MSSAASAQVQVLVTGTVPVSIQEEASRAVSAAFQRADVRPADIRLRLTWHPDDRPRPAVAQVNAEVHGSALRAQVSTGDLDTLAGAAVDRTHAQLAVLGQDWSPRVGPQEAKAWPSRDTRPSGERELVRVKSFSLDRLTSREAARQMDAMDYNFHLHANAETGEGCMVYRIGPTGYRVSTPNAHLGPPAGMTPPLTWQPKLLYRFTEGEAREYLDRIDLPFVYFYEGAVAKVMYRRFDGHYGLIRGRAE